jgi:hypothetical protein
MQLFGRQLINLILYALKLFIDGSYLSFGSLYHSSEVPCTSLILFDSFELLSQLINLEA